LAAETCDIGLIELKVIRRYIMLGNEISIEERTPLPDQTSREWGSALFTLVLLIISLVAASYTILPTASAQSDLIFIDGFESGDLLAWSEVVDGGGDLSASGAAALAGTHGLQIVIDDNTWMYVRDDTPASEPHYRARFYFDPNSITMGTTDAHYIFVGLGAGGEVFRLFMRYWNDTYRLMGLIRDDAGGWGYTSMRALTDEPHYIEIDWQAATGDGANDGYLSLWIDGVLQQTRLGIDNDTRRVDEVRLGPSAGIDTSTRGTYYFDAFESRRETYIGMAGVQAGFSAAPTEGVAPLYVSFTNQSEPAAEITSYLWDFGDGVTSTLAEPVHTYDIPGSYSVSLTAFSDADQVTVTRVDYITVSEEAPPPSGRPSFAEVTDSTGLSAVFDELTFGASWGDFNGDGFPDLLTGPHKPPPGLYRNNGDGTFTDIVESTPLNTAGNRHGGAWGDYDNDGDQDLFIATDRVSGTGPLPNELYRNDESEQFVEVAEQANVSDGNARAQTVSWSDYDRDGDLDAFVANEYRPGDYAPNRLWRNNGDGTFTDVASEAGVAASQVLKAGGFVDYDFDGWPDIFVLGRPNLLYHNKKDGTFDDFTSTTGFANQTGTSYAWGDYDADGDADLFIGTGSLTVDDHLETEAHRALFIGDVRGDEDGFDLEVAGQTISLELELLQVGCLNLSCIHIGANDIQPTSNPFEVGAEANGTPDYSPGVDSGYYIWRDEGTDIWHVRWSDGIGWKRSYAGIVTTTEPILSSTATDMELPPPLSGNALLWRNEGDGTFTELSAEAGLSAPGNYRSANWIDFDNDGWLDLFVADQGTLQSGNGSNHLFHNSSDGTFEDVSALVGLEGTTEGGTNVSAWADYDRNGFLDLFVMNGGYGGNWYGKWPFDKGPQQLFRNEGNTNHWLQLKLVGQISNRQGLGAIVRVAVGVRTWVQTHTDGSVAKCQDASSLHFGLGESTIVDSIVIDWPSGVHQVLTDVSVDQYLTIEEPDSVQ
jgi:PKD repeat protein